MKKYTLILYTLLMYIFLVCILSACSNLSKDKHSSLFPDKYLEKAVRQALHQRFGNISKTDLEKIVVLGDPDFSYDGPKLANLEGIQYMKNLEELRIVGHMKDLTPIQDLQKLRRLSITSDSIQSGKPIPIEDIGPLAKLYNLEFLEIQDTQIKDISPLKNLLHLKELHLFNNKITDLSPLVNLKALDSLFVGWNEIIDITPLSQMPQLTGINLMENKITDLTPLGNLSKLEFLNIDGNPIKDYSPVEKLNIKNLYK